MLEGIKNGWDIIKESVKVFDRHPKFLVPLLITWCLYAPTILYLTYGFNWEIYTGPQIFLIVFGVVFFFAFLLAFSCSMLLELIQQLESQETMNLTKAFSHTLQQNLPKILPIVLIWAIIWFAILVLQALLSRRRRNRKERGSFSAENAARILAGYQRISLSEAFLEAVQKGVRMVIFLILPAIAWEAMSFQKAIKKGLAIFRAHLSEFVTGFVLTEAAALVIFLPPGLLIYITDKFELTLPDFVWYVTIIYVAFAWSYSIYLEQMFTAELYLWHRKWEKEAHKAILEGKMIPTMREIPKPSVLDEVHELLEKSQMR